MSDSPFDGFENATLTLEGTAGPVLVKALLKEATKSPSNVALIQQLGLEASEILVAGYLIDPMDLPDGVVLPLNVTTTLDGRSGLLRLLPVIRSPFGVAEETGYPLRGVFREGN